LDVKISDEFNMAPHTIIPEILKGLLLGPCCIFCIHGKNRWPRYFKGNGFVMLPFQALLLKVIID